MPGDEIDVEDEVDAITPPGELRRSSVIRRKRTHHFLPPSFRTLSCLYEEERISGNVKEMWNGEYCRKLCLTKSYGKKKKCLRKEKKKRKKMRNKGVM